MNNSSNASARLLTKIFLGAGVLLVFLLPQTTNAFTEIFDPISVDTTWTLAESPYVVYGFLEVEPGVTLIVEPGVIVKFEEGAELSVGGVLHANGTEIEPIYFTSIKDDTVGGDTNGDSNASTPFRDWVHIAFTPNAQGSFTHSTIRYGGFVEDVGGPGGGLGSNTGIVNDGAEISLDYVSLTDNGEDGLVQFDGTSNLSNVFVANHEVNGIFISGGSINLDQSVIRNNNHGIWAEEGLVTITASEFTENVNAILSFGASLSVHGSSIYNNTLSGLHNSDSGLVDAIGNWWGNSSGPMTPQNSGGAGEAILYGVFGNGNGSDPNDAVAFAPWLTSDPLEEPQYQECCSSVIFLPGLKGSELSTGSDKLWPPAIGNVPDFSEDILQLALDPETRESVYPVTVDGVLNKFHGTPIYQGFSDFMNTRVPSTIAAWEAFPYDWRFGPEKVIADENMIARLETLAAGSDTGQVTIIAHSMGGLVGKALIKQLEEQGKEELINSFVMVGSPQLGTPQAAASLLHGDDEALPNFLPGLVVDASHVRAVAQNMPGAYNLLPSAEYFNRVADPSIVFDENAGFTEEWRNYWGEEGISNFLDFFSFITGGGVARTNPTDTQLRIPEVLNPDLVTDAHNLHAELDTYVIPENIRVVQVAGWGLPTTKAVRYVTKHFQQNYETVPTTEGDNTVVYISAVPIQISDKYFFDLDTYKSNTTIKIQHRDLLSAEPIQTLLSSVFLENPITETTYITSAKPSVANIQDQLILRSDSPVLLGAYDSLGNFTGIDPNQNLNAAILFATENIPGSTFTSSGESQSIFLPKEGIYTLVYQGIDEGPTTISVSGFSNDIVSPINVYSDIPTQSGAQALANIVSENPEESTLEIDEDGDGELDQLIAPDGSELPLTELLVFLKEKIQNLDVKEKLKKKLLNRIEKLEKKIEKKKKKNQKILDKLQKKINKKADKGKIDSGDADAILELIEELEAQSEGVVLDQEILDELKATIQNIDAPHYLKLNLLRRVERLENTKQLTRTLERFSKAVIHKGEKGRIFDEDAEDIIKLIERIESVL